MINKDLQLTNNHRVGQAQCALNHIFQKVYQSAANGKSFAYITDFGFLDLNRDEFCTNTPPLVRDVLVGLFRYNIKHKITSRGLRVSIPRFSIPSLNSRGRA
ncbi:hypothetical protein FH968_00100 [Buttiauxella sp. B2]|uniref:hypothetical protein n=1 Tax=Buttiauxella sp. B2 TaxID=2587812 RepID=UPI00112490D6|nr:hypothetical protein [Buttiauxella sp. B2]TNV22502.1 hypothetical protein FH968_00100 [Buttiauxella sp. B2]